MIFTQDKTIAKWEKYCALNVDSFQIFYIHSANSKGDATNKGNGYNCSPALLSTIVQIQKRTPQIIQTNGVKTTVSLDDKFIGSFFACFVNVFHTYYVVHVSIWTIHERNVLAKTKHHQPTTDKKIAECKDQRTAFSLVGNI